MQIHQDQKREEKCRSLTLTMLLYGHLGHVGYSKQAGKAGKHRICWTGLF